MLRLLALLGVGLALLGAQGARGGDAKTQIEEVIVTGERPKTPTTSGPRSSSRPPHISLRQSSV